MDHDQDLAGLLPDLPPPRPARREAALAAAMRRFDGLPDAPVAATPRPARRWATRWAPAGAFASIAIVAVVSITLSLRTPILDPVPPAPKAAEQAEAVQPSARPQPAQPTGAARAPAASREAGALKARDTAPAAEPQPYPTPEARPDERFGPYPQHTPDAKQVGELARAEPEAPQARAGIVAPAPRPSGEIVVTGNRVARAPVQSSNVPITVVTEDSVDSRDVVVTGTARARKSAGRGDWNACTVDDPSRSLRGCGALIDPGAGGARGEAAADQAQGLALAWRGDWRGAIAAFDRAIARDPRAAIAWLNRGIARQRSGDPAGAATDFDRAIRYAPSEARGYYYRSLLRRAQGDRRGAKADADRAISRDPNYADLLD